jgi:hypothetical protein
VPLSSAGPRISQTTAASCPSCAADFECGRHASEGCWCATLEPLGEQALAGLAAFAGRCLCPLCLAEQIARERESA